MENIKINIKNLTIYLPKKIINNITLDKRFGLKKNTLFNLTGIQKRRVSSNYETTESMAIKATQNLVKKYRGKLNITHIITVTNTPSVFFPSISHFILSKIQKFHPLQLFLNLLQKALVFFSNKSFLSSLRQIFRGLYH